MSDTATSVLGKCGRRTYYTTIRASPDFDVVEDFAVTVHYNDSKTEQEVEIARIDTAHDTTHFDRLYRRDQPKDPVSMTVWEAATYLEENWRQFARSFERK